MNSELIQSMVACAGRLAARQPGQPASDVRLAPDVCWYPQSWRRHRGVDYWAARQGARHFLVIASQPAGAEPELSGRFPGEVTVGGARPVRIVPRSAPVCAALRRLFPETAPMPLPAGVPSFGFGDRLGLATPGHIRAVRRYAVAPVFAQQSVRELTLAGRTFGEVLDAATWGVFQEGYRNGFTADGDHLTTLDQVQAMLAAGATCITLDLSRCLDRGDLRPDLPPSLCACGGKTHAVGDRLLRIEPEDIERFWQRYGAAFPFIEDAAAMCRATRGADGCSLEVSVDETPEPTRPVDHWLLALELQRRGVHVQSVAPRFPGEFQKGIDYIGDLDALAEAIGWHAAIAQASGHKLGVHSGSDKFRVFPLLAQMAGGRLHVKTAGTSWLEALRVVAAIDPPLFCNVWTQAVAGFARATQHYHVRATPADVVSAIALPDGELPALLDQDAPRQLLHITYGEVLQSPAEDGRTLGDWIRERLLAHEERYCARLEAHFRRHLDALGFAAAPPVSG